MVPSNGEQAARFLDALDGAGAARMTSTFDFGPAPKLEAASERVVDACVTNARLEPLRRKIPITRVADLTPLDPIGLPVFVAVTPLAADLTTHTGKGTTAIQARVSAVMEAVERVSAERTTRAACFRSSFDKLRGRRSRAIDPRRFQLPPGSSYEPSRKYTWVEGVDLLRREPAIAPLDLVVNPPREGILESVDTNGLASGNTMLEAVVHGLCEVIERDAVSQLVFAERFADSETVESLCREVDLGSLPDAASRYLDALAAQSLGLRVHELTTDVGVPTFRVFVKDDAYPSTEGPMRVDFAGYGTHPEATVALMRALTEAIQSRVGVVQGARDAFGLLQNGPHAMRSRPAPVRFSELHSRPAMDLREDLDFLLNRLSACGAPSVLAFDLTREDVGVPVVRIRVPGFSSYLVNLRRVGWRCLRHLVA